MRRPVVSLFAALMLLIQTSPATSQSNPSGHKVSLNGFEMYYETLGEGEPLLLVHGWSGNASYFEPLLGQLAEKYRLIIPELRGHGRSTNPSGEFTMGQSALDLFALLDHLGLGPVSGIGASAGSLILLHMASSQPSRVEKMVLVGTGNRFLPHCRESMAAANADEYPESWWEVMRARHAYGDDQIQSMVEYLRSFAANETDVAFEASHLSEIQAETLIVNGDRDWCFPTSLAAELHGAIPDASLWVIPGGEHVPILGEHAPQFLNLALTFLDSRQGGE